MTELELLARLIQCEAGGEGTQGMMAVASVIMNRVSQSSGEYGRQNTIRDVIYAPRQFECVGDQPQSIYNMNPERIHYDIATWAINGGRVSDLGEAMWFFNPYSDTCRTNFPNKNGYFQARINNHCFYAPTSGYYST